MPTRMATSLGTATRWRIYFPVPRRSRPSLHCSWWERASSTWTCQWHAIGPSLPQQGKSASPCVSCSATRPGCRRSTPVCLARRLGLDFHVGLADEEFHRVAHIARGKGSMGDAAAQRLLRCMMSEPNALSTRAFTNPPSVMTSTNKPEWRRMQQPAANGHGTARSLAGFYSGLLDGRLLEPDLLAELTREHCRGEDRTLLTSTRFGLGC